MQDNINAKVYKYILIDTNSEPSYAYLGVEKLTKNEANIKNRAFRMNSVSKKFVLEKDWK
jgi:hypothetical protein